MYCSAGCTKDPNVCDKCDKNFYGPRCDIEYTCTSKECKTTIYTSKATKVEGNLKSGNTDEISQVSETSSDYSDTSSK